MDVAVPMVLKSGVHFAAAFAVLGCAPMLLAQNLSTGAVGGQVLDRQGHPAAGVRVSLRQAVSAVPRQMLTDAQGEFLFPAVAPGAATLLLNAAAFEPVRIENLAVTLGETSRTLVTLRVAAVAATVAVRAEDTALPSLADTPVNATLSPRELLDLPLDGRRFQTFALLTPLVNLADTPGDTDADVAGATTDDIGDAAISSDNVRLSIRGVDPSQNSDAQDGLSSVRAYDGEPRGGGSLPFNVPLEAVQEFQVRALGAGTPLGRDAGGSVNAVTLRGTDTLHGSAFFLLRNSAVGAADPFAVATRYNSGNPTSVTVKPRDQREQFGGSLGRVLPGTHGHLFAFASAEEQHRSFPGVSSPSVPAFYTLTATQRALLGNRGVSGTNIDRALTFLDSLTGEVPRFSNEVSLFPRLDYDHGAHTTAALSYTRVRFNAPSGLRDETVVARSRDAFGTVSTHTDSLAASWSQTLSRRWLNQFRVQVSRDAVFVQLPTPLAQEPHSAPAGLVPQVTIDLGDSSTAGAFVFGTPASLQKRRLPQEKRAEVFESVTLNSHAHTLTLGVDGSLIDTAVDTGLATNGAYQYASGATGGRAGGLVDFLTDYTYSATAYPNGGCPSIYATTHLFCFQGYTQSFGAATTTRFHVGEAAAFLREAWRIRPGLRVDFGARYEYFRMPLPSHPNAVFDGVFGSFAATNYFPGDPGNLAPHLAVAYAPTQRTVVRVGYSIHFGRVTGRVLQQALQNTALASSTYSIHFTPRTEVDPACASVGTNFGYPATYSCAPTGAVARTSNATVLARRFQLPMLQEGELTVEHGFAHGTTLSATYALTLERELLNTIDLNIATSTARAAFQIVRDDGRGEPGVRNGTVFNVPLYTARVSPLFGPVTAVLSNGTGTDHAAVLQLTRVATHGVTVRAAYTFSKSVDSVRHTGAGIDQDAQFDPRDAAYDKGLSNYDRQQKVTASVVITPEFHRERRAVRTLANGWSLAPIVFATTGRPYSYLIEGGTYLPGGRTSINGSGGATYLPTVGRNTLRLPWTQTTDLRLQRTFTGRSRVHTRLSAEAFNLFNHRNITAVQQRAFLAGATVGGITPLVYQDASTIAAEGLTTLPFGTPRDSATLVSRQRRLQFGLRVDF